MNKIIFKDLEIEHVCKPTLKNSYISVNKNAKIVLRTPKVSQKFITDLLTKKEDWIRKHLLSVASNKPEIVNLEDELLLFGDIYSIDVQEARELREFLSALKIQNQKNILKCYDNFYKLYANKYLIPRTVHFSNIMNLDYKEIKFRKMKSRWGSCSYHGVITLNIELVKIKKELIDYVIVHELAHLVHMNHSKNFHNLVQKYIINSRLIRQELKKIHLHPNP
ncbi:MAG: SprT family zinc-dependent metalloprotease [Campylobacterales bacterium]|nr:SprT family zinc-dependent metalloprotease [Campylobacterales bacterium]